MTVVHNPALSERQNHVKYPSIRSFFSRSLVPAADEIHKAVWNRVGLATVQEFVREWASSWVAQVNGTEAARQEKLKLAQETLENWSGPEDAIPGERLYLLPDDLQEAIWQSERLLPLPPSHRPRSVVEKWAALAAVHDVFDFTGEKIFPWPLPGTCRKVRGQLAGPRGTFGTVSGEREGILGNPPCRRRNAED